MTYSTAQGGYSDPYGTASQEWTPAPRGGLIPLQPFGFGTILGKSFAALRGNPKVLLGFAMGMQVITSAIAIVIVGLVSVKSLSRLDTVDAWSDDYDQIMAGSLVMIGATTIVVSMLASAVSVLVQAVVIGEVSFAALGERAKLSAIFGRVKRGFWRVFGYNVLVVIAVIGGLAVIGGIAAALTYAVLPLGIVFIVIAVAGLTVLICWLTTKLYLVPSAILLEHQTLFGGVRRSWQLTRRRFWSTFGVWILISSIMATVSYIIALPFSLFGGVLGSVLAPTGDETGGLIASLGTAAIGEAASVVVASISTVVTSTSAVLVYLNARMVTEGIDLRMQEYVDRRDMGAPIDFDPYAYDPAATPPQREPEPWQVPPQGFAAPVYPGQQSYGQPQYPAYGQPYGQPPYGQPAYGQQYPPQYPQAQYPQQQQYPAPQYGQQPQPHPPQQPPQNPPA
ncbi:MAG: hypothetical protein QM607_04545 [Microbacterium sp.]